MMSPPYFHENLTSAHNPLSPIIIIGSHRSGTSLLNQLLELLNVHMGDVQEANHEAVCFLTVNDLILRSAQAHWARPEPFLKQLRNDRFITQCVELARQALDDNIHLYGKVIHDQQWGWKDPRTTLTLPIWVRLFPQARVVHIVRNGIDVGLSLMRREQRRFLRRLLLKRLKTELMFPPTFARGYSLWSLYTSQATLDTTGYGSFYVIRYEDIIRDPVSEITKLVSFLGVQVDNNLVLEATKDTIKSPRSRSRAESLLVRWSLALKLVDDKELSRWGYSLDS